MAKRFAIAEAEVDALRLNFDFDAAYKSVRGWKSHYAQTGQVSAGHPSSQLFEALRLTVQAEYHLLRHNDNDCRTYLQRALASSPTYADALIVTCKLCLSRGLWPSPDQAGRSHTRVQGSLSKALNPLLGGTAAARVPTLSSLVNLSSSTPSSSSSWPPDVLLTLVDVITNRLQEGAQACSQYRVLLRIQACTLLCEVCAGHPALVHSACLVPYSPVWALACTVRPDGPGGEGTPDALQQEQVAARVALGAVDAAWKLLKTVAKVPSQPSPLPSSGLSLLTDLPPAELYASQAWGHGEAEDAQRALCAALALSWSKVQEASGSAASPGPESSPTALSMVLSALHPSLLSEWARLLSGVPSWLHTCQESRAAFHAALLALHPKLGQHQGAAAVARTVGRLASSLSASGCGRPQEAEPSTARVASMACLAALQAAPQDVHVWWGVVASMSQYLLHSSTQSGGTSSSAVYLPCPAPSASLQAACTVILTALQHCQALPGDGEDEDRRLTRETACMALLACGCPPAWALSCLSPSIPRPLTTTAAGGHSVLARARRMKAANAVACAHSLLAEAVVSDRHFYVSMLTPTLSSTCHPPAPLPPASIRPAQEAWGYIAAWMQEEYTKAQEGEGETPRPVLPSESMESPVSPQPLPRVQPQRGVVGSEAQGGTATPVHALWPILYNQGRMALCSGDVAGASQYSRACLNLLLSLGDACDGGSGSGPCAGMDMPWALATLVAAHQQGPAEAAVVLLPALAKYPDSILLRLCEARIAECLCVAGEQGSSTTRIGLRQAVDGITLLSMYQDVADKAEQMAAGVSRGPEPPALPMQLGIPGGLAGRVVSVDGGQGGSATSWHVRCAAAVYGHCARVAASEGLLEAAHAAVIACQAVLTREQWQGRGQGQGQGEQGVGEDVPLAHGHPAFIGQGTCTSPAVQADILAITGMLHESVGAISSAQSQYMAALALVPDHVPVLLRLADTTLTQAWQGVRGEGEDLAEAARSAKIPPQDLSDALALAQRSRVYVQRALRADPTCGEAWHMLSLLAGAVGEKEGELEAAEQAVASGRPAVLLPPMLLPLLL